jgi:hypothetical protein
LTIMNEITSSPSFAGDFAQTGFAGLGGTGLVIEDIDTAVPQSAALFTVCVVSAHPVPVTTVGQLGA